MLGFSQPKAILQEEAAVIILFCRAAAPDPHAGEGYLQKIRPEDHRLPLTGKGHILQWPTLSQPLHPSCSTGVFSST